MVLVVVDNDDVDGDDVDGDGVDGCGGSATTRERRDLTVIWSEDNWAPWC